MSVIHSKFIIRFYLLLLSILIATAAYAAILVGGKHSGIVIFDRWDGCIFYQGPFIFYVSEDIKEKLRDYSDKFIELDLTDMSRPLSSSDALITKFSIISSKEELDKQTASNIKLNSVFSSREDGKPSITIILRNSGKEEIQIDSGELSPTLLTTIPKDRWFIASNSKSYAIISRISLYSHYTWMIERQWTHVNTSYTLEMKEVLPRNFYLLPNTEHRIRMDLDLSPGEYDFLAGYRAGDVQLASNLVAFNVDENGKSTKVEIKGR